MSAPPSEADLRALVAEDVVNLDNNAPPDGRVARAYVQLLRQAVQIKKQIIAQDGDG